MLPVVWTADRPANGYSHTRFGLRATDLLALCVPLEDVQYLVGHSLVVGTTGN